MNIKTLTQNPSSSSKLQWNKTKIFQPTDCCLHRSKSKSKQSHCNGCQPYVPAAFHLPGKLLALISVKGWVKPWAIMWLEGLGKMGGGADHSMTSLGFRPVIFQPVEQCLKQLHHHVPPILVGHSKYIKHSQSSFPLTENRLTQYTIMQ
jgi:hypothetical protein